MPYPENLCSHFNSVIDEKEGSVICTDCGLVIEDKLFKFYEPCQKEKKSFLEEEVNEILSKLGLPDVFTKTILRNLENEEENRRKKKVFLEYVICKTLNDNSIPISICLLLSISASRGVVPIILCFLLLYVSNNLENFFLLSHLYVFCL